jgi:hypothetical protein
VSFAALEVFFTLPNMPPLAAQTIYELVQVWKNAALAFFRVKKLCLQSVKSLSEVFSSLVISFTLCVCPMQRYI